jgi:hypothetical protein
LPCRSSTPRESLYANSRSSTSCIRQHTSAYVSIRQHMSAYKHPARELVCKSALLQILTGICFFKQQIQDVRTDPADCQ